MSLTKAVIFDTEGVIDMRAFTVFGMNSKPRSVSPIGYFGTGLKYAVAVLMRNGIGMRVWRDGKCFEFVSDEIMFREKKFSRIRMRKLKRGGLGSLLSQRVTDLPFTTELGKNWEIWQAFRELYSNTLDESGDIRVEEIDLSVGADRVRGRTVIEVYGEKFLDEYYKRDETFLPGASRDRSDVAIEILGGQCQFLYYRGMRVMKLSKPSMRTYNVLESLNLTEDRTVQYPFLAGRAVADYVAKSRDTDLIRQVLRTPKGSWEEDLPWDMLSSPPSEEFRREVYRKNGVGISSGARGYVGGYSGLSSGVDPLYHHPAPWRVEDKRILDGNDKCILAPSYEATSETALLELVCNVLNEHAGYDEKGQLREGVKPRLSSSPKPPEIETALGKIVRRDLDDEIPF